MAGTRGRVLIVEDNLALLFALRSLFAASGWEVVLSKTTSDAIALIDAAPDWIILDLMLADGDGEDVLRYVRETGVPSRVAVFSAAIDLERLAELRRLKPDLVIPKPISFARLLEACNSRGVVAPLAAKADRALIGILEHAFLARGGNLEGVSR